MKNQKTLIVVTIILIISALITQTVYLRKQREVGSDIKTTETTSSSSQSKDVSMNQSTDRVEEDHQSEKMTREQVVQISANAFVSLYLTNDESDRLQLKDYTTTAVFEKIINNTSLTEKREVLLVNLTDLRLEADEFTAKYAVDVQTEKEKKTLNMTLKLIEVNQNWVVETYEIS